MEWDRFKKGFASLVHAVQPRIDYMKLSLARVVKQAQDLSALDVVPDDPDLPSMGGIPLRHGVPGMQVAIRPGANVLVGFSESDPSRPYCGLWPDGPTVMVDDPADPPAGPRNLVKRLTFHGDEVNVGGAGAEATIRGETYRQAEAQAHAALAATLDGMVSACTGALAPLASGFTALAETIRAFEQGSPGYLSTNAKVR